jgi:serine/threonine protein kinase
VEGTPVGALTCVLYECLTGQRPFPGGVEQQVTGHLTKGPPRPSIMRPGVSPLIDPIIAKGMAKDPDTRYRSTLDLAKAAPTALAAPIEQPTTPVATRPVMAVNPGHPTVPSQWPRPPHLLLRLIRRMGCLPSAPASAVHGGESCAQPTHAAGPPSTSHPTPNPPPRRQPRQADSEHRPAAEPSATHSTAEHHRRTAHRATGRRASPATGTHRRTTAAAGDTDCAPRQPVACAPMAAGRWSGGRVLTAHRHEA